jgi:hypothetical protein
MPSGSVTSAVVSVLEEQPPDEALSPKEITNRVTQRLQSRDRIPEDNEIRGRLTQLRRQGVVKRPERGRYTLVRARPHETAELAQLVDVLEDVLRPEALRRTVVWDATPYLELAEDGGPGTRLVVEHEQAASLKDEIGARWPQDRQVFTWTVKRRGPIGDALWEPDEPAAYRMQFGIVFVEGVKLGASGLTPRGYRSPFTERVMMEFLGFEGPAEATPIVRSILEDPEVEYERLEEAAETLGRLADFRTLLAERGSALPPELREAFLQRLPPVVQALAGGRL